MENEINEGVKAPEIYGPYQSGCSVIIIANDVVGMVKVLEVDNDDADTGLVLAIIPEGDVSQTAVVLTQGKFRIACYPGASVARLHVERPTAPFKTAAAIVSNGGGLDLIPQDGGVYGVTYINGQYQGVAVDRKPLIDKTVYDDISQMTQVLPPGTYDFEVACLAISEATGGTNWQECNMSFKPNSTATADISDPTITELVDLVSAIGAEYLLSSASYVGTEVRSPLKIGPQGLYLSYVNNTEHYGAVYMANTTVRLKIKQTTTITFSNLISKMFATAIGSNWREYKCVPHVIKVYPV